MNSLIHHDPKEEEKTYTPGEKGNKMGVVEGRKKFQMISDRIICDVGVKKIPRRDRFTLQNMKGLKKFFFFLNKSQLDFVRFTELNSHQLGSSPLRPRIFNTQTV